MEYRSDFFEAIKTGKFSKVISLLDFDPLLITARDEQGVSAILVAVYYGQVDILGELLKRVVELDIWEASATGHLLRVKELLDQDISLLNAFSPDGFTPLGLAAFFGRRDVLEELISRGADVNIPANNPMRVQPLHSAAAHRDMARATQMAQLLLEKGANVNATQSGGWTPLHEAAFHGEIELAKLLIHWGADRTIKSDDGKTPIDVALQQGHTDLVAVFQSAEET